MHSSQNFGRTVNRSPPASQACAEASASDRSPLTESPAHVLITHFLIKNKKLDMVERAN